MKIMNNGNSQASRIPPPPSPDDKEDDEFVGFKIYASGSTAGGKGKMTMVKATKTSETSEEEEDYEFVGLKIIASGSTTAGKGKMTMVKDNAAAQAEAAIKYKAKNNEMDKAATTKTALITATTETFKSANEISEATVTDASEKELREAGGILASKLLQTGHGVKYIQMFNSGGGKLHLQVSTGELFETGHCLVVTLSQPSQVATFYSSRGHQLFRVELKRVPVPSLSTDDGDVPDTILFNAEYASINVIKVFMYSWMSDIMRVPNHVPHRVQNDGLATRLVHRISDQLQYIEKLKFDGAEQTVHDAADAELTSLRKRLNKIYYDELGITSSGKVNQQQQGICASPKDLVNDDDDIVWSKWCGLLSIHMSKIIDNLPPSARVSRCKNVISVTTSQLADYGMQLEIHYPSSRCPATGKMHRCMENAIVDFRVVDGCGNIYTSSSVDAGPSAEMGSWLLAKPMVRFIVHYLNDRLNREGLISIRNIMSRIISETMAACEERLGLEWTESNGSQFSFEAVSTLDTFEIKIRPFPLQFRILSSSSNSVDLNMSKQNFQLDLSADTTDNTHVTNILAAQLMNVVIPRSRLLSWFDTIRLKFPEIGWKSNMKDSEFCLHGSDAVRDISMEISIDSKTRDFVVSGYIYKNGLRHRHHQFKIPFVTTTTPPSSSLLDVLMKQLPITINACKKEATKK